ncbi:hypothetical protein F53441_3331 [Fusarium austroafricanum]|uniref:Synaptobrevin n=1 Tax=Fusarium austroafricanum TaxID=2364996 RepID=A0A8H4NWT2_9HYPO|nr:hypothetical protein F53441_3331 [Fusarium austroafricanum]
MARTSQQSSPSINRSAIDIASAELGNILLRLQKTVLHTDSDREQRLRSSEFDRTRVASLAIDEDEDDGSTDGEDILSEIIPTPSDSMVDSISTGQPTESSGQDDDADSEPPETSTIPVTTATAPVSTAPPETSTSPQQPTQTTQNLRPRGEPSSPLLSAHSTARAALFANRSKPTPQTSTATAEALLDRDRAEQELISGSILKMAGALKASSQRFSNTLEADKEVVERAGEGMDKTEQSMDAARGRMGMLKRMTEGKGWMGRMLLYVYILLLTVACLLVVFVFPKLRFS